MIVYLAAMISPSYNKQEMLIIFVEIQFCVVFFLNILHENVCVTLNVHFAVSLSLGSKLKNIRAQLNMMS